MNQATVPVSANVTDNVWIILVLVLLAIAVLAVVIVLTLRKARKNPETPHGAGEMDAERPPVRSLSAKGMVLAFTRGLRFLRERVAGRDYRYEVPWILMLGPAGAGKTTALAHAARSAPLAGRGGPTLGVPGGPEWWFYERGLVLNAPGSIVLRSDGRTSDHEGWFGLLLLLARRRPRRPLDAVVLAISAEDLLNTENATGNTTGNATSSRADLTTRAEILGRKLSELRQTVSMRLPVYILVTQCDRIPGFSSFAGELPAALPEEIFGWSNPYPLEAAFSPDWVDQCCREMHDRIVEQQMEIFVERDELREPDGVFLFPSQFQAICAPLKQYLALICRSTAYEESYYFRGIYFCGDIAAGAIERSPVPVSALVVSAQSEGPGESAPGESAIESAREGVLIPSGFPRIPIPDSAESRSRRPVFLKQLFERKIFPESFLARPLSVLDMSRNRTVLTAKILTALFVLVAGIGTWVSCARIASLKRDPLDPLLGQLPQDLKKHEQESQDAWHSVESETDKAERRNRATVAANQVLRSMAALSEDRLFSLFLPASWNREVDNNLKKAMRRAFGDIVLDGFRIDLINRLQDLISATGGRMCGSKDDGLKPEAQQADTFYDAFTAVPAYQQWSQYISGLRELEQNIGRYNRIAMYYGDGTPDDLKQLLKYLHMDSGLSDFDFNNPTFQKMLQESQWEQFSFHIADPRVCDAEEAANHARELIQGFFTVWFGTGGSGSRLALDVDQMIDSINQFPDRRGDTVNYLALKDVADSIGRVSADLDNPAFSSLLGDDFALDQYPAFNQKIDDLQYLGDLHNDEIENDGKESFLQFTSDLAAKSTRLTGQVLAVDGSPVQLTGPVSALEANLRLLLGQTFVAREPGPAPRLDAARPLWDRNTLLDAVKLFDAYDKYERGALRTASPLLREALQRVAVDRLQQNALDYVGEAQGDLLPGLRDGADVQSFNQSLDVLQQLLADFGKSPASMSSRNLNSVVVAQASRILLAIERELNERNLYAVRDQSFDWWEGEKPLSLAAYDVRTADDLKDYVDRERDQVAALAQQADPLVKFLQGRSGTLGPQETQALSDWRTISQELKRYSDKVPGNSVSLLEDFIRTGMDKIAPESSCQDSSTRDPAGRADYFLARRRLLRTGTLARCRALTQPIYTTQIATLFNRRLAERFPFSTTAPQSGLQEADPAALVEFYGKLDQYSKAATDSLNQNSQLGKSRDAALVFLSQMAAIRPVFAAFLMGADKNPAPSFDFVVNFRVNRDKEIGGDQIFDWSLDVGPQSFQSRAKENTGRWRLGDPIRVTLRFAADSPVVPLPDSSQPGMSVRQRTVTFEYTGAWSLFQLLLDHKGGVADFNSGVDPMPHTLSFNFGTTPDSTLPQRRGAPEQVRVYLQLTVVPTGAKDSVAVPLPFPVRAPVLSGNN